MLVTLLYCFDAKAQHDPFAISFDGSRLVYFSDAENNRIPDYSHAGYRGGGVNLPNVPVKIEIGPIEGDNRAHIQNAINKVSKMRLDSHGYRGAVLLKPGKYWINGNLFIRESGVVLRGSGDEENASENTIITVSQAVTGDVLQIGDETAVWFRSEINSTTTLKTPFIPVGTRSFEVHDPEKFEAGDNIVLRLISTQQWLDSVNGGGTALGPNWEPGFLDIFYNRTIVSKQDSVITMDAPVYNHVDTTLSTPIVYKPIRNNLVTESGVENLRIEIQTGGELTEGHAENGVVFRGVENVWANNVTVLHFVFSGFSTHTSKNVTVANSKALEPHSQINSGNRYNFNAGPFSNQILFTNVRSSSARRDFVSNGTSVTSGVVFHQSRSFGALNSSEGHQRWSQGLLYDSISFINPQFYNVLSLHNRGDFGSSHGWAAVHSTAWNVEAEDSYIFIQKPPGAQNYGIGNRANVNGEGLFNQPEGYIEGIGMNPLPTSLYDAQLAERLKHGLPPDMPLDFRLSNDQEGSLTIFWIQLPPVGTVIKIERSQDGFAFNEIAKIPAVDERYEDQNVAEMEYTYRIRAFRDGRYSAYTYPKSATPTFTEESISGFDLLSPASNAEFIIEGEPENEVAFQWGEAESKLEIMYHWQLTDAEDNEKVLLMRDSLQTTQTSLSFRDIQNIMIENEVKKGDSLRAMWTVLAESKTIQKRAESISTITLVPKFSEESISDFDLLSPTSDTDFIIEGEPKNEVVFQWEEAESKQEVIHRWQLTDAKDAENVLLMRESPQTTQIAISFGDIQKIMIENGVEEGDSLKASWTVYAESKTLQKQAERVLPITFQRAVVFDSDLLNGEEAFLDQNYPNPFNPLTTIAYHLSEDSQVRLSVYNISGVKVADLDSGFKERGTHTVTFEAGNFASGVYFYRLQTGSIVQIRKMLLIK